MIAERKTNDPAYGYNLSKGGDGLDPDIIKHLWDDEEFKRIASENMREAWKDPEKRKRRSERAKERWANPEFKDKAVRSVTEACARRICCVETGIVYSTIKDAANDLGVHRANITRSAKVGYRCGGYHWKYVDNVS